MQDESLKKSIKRLSETLNEKKINDVLFDAICKRFEVCFEYTWKHLKRLTNEAGQEVYSPKDAIREGVKLKLIDDMDLWMKFLHERNLSVHNYYAGDPDATLEIIKKFLNQVKKLR